MQVRQFDNDSLRRAADAKTMLAAFESVGVKSCDVTERRENPVATEAQTTFTRRKKTAAICDRLLPAWMQFTPFSPVSNIRPHLPRSSRTALVQLDDLTEATVERVSSFACCATETSPNNFQAFVAVADGAVDYDRLRQGLIAATGADRGATGATRLAGTFNAKPIHKRDDGTYPQVHLVFSNPYKIVPVADLESAGVLLQTPIPSAAPHLIAGRAANRPMRRLPSYTKALAAIQSKNDGEPDRSAADLLFAVTCLRWHPPLTPHQIAALLIKNSDKARERADAEDYVWATIDAAMRRA
jgi:hypothetical protein